MPFFPIGAKYTQRIYSCSKTVAMSVIFFIRVELLVCSCMSCLPAMDDKLDMEEMMALLPGTVVTCTRTCTPVSVTQVYTHTQKDTYTYTDTYMYTVRIHTYAPTHMRANVQTRVYVYNYN